MTNEFLVGAGTALWLGLLTAISPCPMATNIAAVSYVARRVGSPRRVLAAGLLYTLGRILAYVSLGAAIVFGLLSIPGAARFLQQYLSKALGPLLIVVGLVLLELVPLPFLRGGGRLAAGAQAAADRWGLAGSVLLGLLFGLSFCPISAALFFGSLVPLAVRHGSGLALPALYGLATGLPVLVLAVPMALGARWVSRAFERVGAFERWARRATGVIFILVGVYETLRYVFGVL